MSASLVGSEMCIRDRASASDWLRRRAARSRRGELRTDVAKGTPAVPLKVREAKLDPCLAEPML
eukprot:14907001-Alexandrium_andersonii.AAC.1